MRAPSLLRPGLMLVAAAAAPVPETRPVTIVTTLTGTGVTVDVVGRAETATNVRYRLVLEGRSTGGVNRTDQSGAARLEPARETLLLRNRLGDVTGGGWHATLTVTLADGEYEIVREGAGEP